MRGVLALILALALVAAARGADANDLMQAQAAYDRGMTLKTEGKAEEARAAFAEAANGLRGLVAAGADNFGLHFNLGNASVQAGDLGRGIASYLRAERLSPNDSALRANLSTARSDVRTRLSGSLDDAWSGSLAVWRAVSERNRTVVAVAAWVLFWMLVAPAIAGRRLPNWLRGLRAAALVIALVLGASVGFDRFVDRARPLGVIVTDDVVLRKGNGDGFQPEVEERLSNGVEFRLMERRPQWLRVRLSDGTEGWVKESQAEIA